MKHVSQKARSTSSAFWSTGTPMSTMVASTWFTSPTRSVLPSLGSSLGLLLCSLCFKLDWMRWVSANQKIVSSGYVVFAVKRLLQSFQPACYQRCFCNKILQLSYLGNWPGVLYIVDHHCSSRPRPGHSCQIWNPEAPDLDRPLLQRHLRPPLHRHLPLWAHHWLHRTLLHLHDCHHILNGIWQLPHHDNSSPQVQ